MTIDISILCCTNRIEWAPWLHHQLEKQCKYLKTKELLYNIYICTPKDSIEKYFKDLKIESETKLFWNLKVIKVSEDLNIGQMRNTVCNAANGAYLAFMDDDDWYPEYRVHYQWKNMMLYGAKNQMFVHTTDTFLCYDIFKDESFWIASPSESLLFFKNSFFHDSEGFKGERGEGQSFVGSAKLGLENKIELMIALTHDKHLNPRSSTQINAEYIGKGFDLIFVEHPFDKFEKDFIEDYKVKNLD